MAYVTPGISILYVVSLTACSKGTNVVPFVQPGDLLLRIS